MRKPYTNSRGEQVQWISTHKVILGKDGKYRCLFHRFASLDEVREFLRDWDNL